MPFYKNGAFTDDRWLSVSEIEAVPPAGHVILDLQRWQIESSWLSQTSAPLGLVIEPGTAIEEFIGDLHRFDLIALVFPKFQDGRAFSTAHLLRTRHGFKGELRAKGEVLLDELQAMLRCGFDAFEINDPATERALREGKLPQLREFYQPALGPEVPAGTRPWARRLAR
jgi:uncharacterized protein (DUF934 family)